MSAVPEPHDTLGPEASRLLSAEITLTEAPMFLPVEGKNPVTVNTEVNKSTESPETFGSCTSRLSSAKITLTEAPMFPPKKGNTKRHLKLGSECYGD